MHCISHITRVVFLNACSFLKYMFHPKRFLKSKIKMFEPLLNYLGSLVLKVIHVTNIHDNVEFTVHDPTFDIFHKKAEIWPSGFAFQNCP